MGAAPGWPDRRGLARPDFHRPTLARAPGEQPVRRADHRRRAHARPRSVHRVGRISMKREDLEHILRAASKIAGGYLAHRLDDGHRPADRWVIEARCSSRSSCSAAKRSVVSMAVPGAGWATPETRIPHTPDEPSRPALDQ